MIIEKDCDYGKKNLIIEKNVNNWKRLWLLKKIVIIEKDCDN